MVNGDPDATKHCRVYGQVCHSNPDVESVEDLEAEFMNSVGFFCFFLSRKKNIFSSPKLFFTPHIHYIHPFGPDDTQYNSGSFSKVVFTSSRVTLLICSFEILLECVKST
jgi:hypothetical protein